MITSQRLYRDYTGLVAKQVNAIVLTLNKLILDRRTRNLGDADYELPLITIEGLSATEATSWVVHDLIKKCEDNGYSGIVLSRTENEKYLLHLEWNTGFSQSEHQRRLKALAKYSNRPMV